MLIFYLKLSIFTVFLKNRNFISKIKRSKVTDNAALKVANVVIMYRRDILQYFVHYSHIKVDCHKIQQFQTAPMSLQLASMQ